MAVRGFVTRTFDAERDLKRIFELYQNPKEQALFAQRVPITSLAEFAEWFEGNLRDAYHDFSVIAREDSGELAGFVFSYDYHPFDLHCKVCIYVAGDLRGTGLAAWAAVGFLDELFCAYPLRKVYALVYDYNRASLESNLQAGFVEEGRLAQYRFYAGAWHDCHILGLDRARFYECCGGLLQTRGSL